MRNINITKTVYLFNELESEEAKTKARKEYIEYTRSNMSVKEIMRKYLTDLGINDVCVFFELHKDHANDSVHFCGNIDFSKFCNINNFYNKLVLRFGESLVKDIITKCANINIMIDESFPDVIVPNISIICSINELGLNVYKTLISILKREYETICVQLYTRALSFYENVDNNDIIREGYEFEKDGSWYISCNN